MDTRWWLCGVATLAFALGCGDDSTSVDAGLDSGPDAGDAAMDAPLDAAPVDAPPDDVSLDGPTGPCSGLTCSDHGQCVEAGGAASCECDLGWSSTGTDCESTPGWFPLADSVSRGFGSGSPDEHTLLFDSTGTPYVVWLDDGDDVTARFNLGIRRFVDGSWEALPPITGSIRRSNAALGAAFNDADELVVMYPKANDPPTVQNGFIVSRWDGTSWVMEGEGTATYLALGVHGDVASVATYRGSSMRVTRFGGPGGSLPGLDVQESRLQMALDAAGNPVVAARGTEVVVTRHDGTDWAPYPMLTSTTVLLEDLRLIGDEPVVLFFDGEVQRFTGGSWATLAPAYADRDARCGSLANFGDAGLLAAWEEDPDPNDVYARIFDGTTWNEIAGSATGGGVSDSTADSQCPVIAAHGDLVCILWEEGYTRLALKCAISTP